MPWIGEKAAARVSREWEIDLGQQMYESLMTTFKIDENRTRLLNKFYDELSFASKYPVTITVVSSKEVNAFAIPGGNIVVYSALLDRIQTAPELAGLLSHEGSHIELRHSLRNMFRTLARKMFLMLIVGSESGIAGYLVSNADNLKGLEYSRSLETEADNYGLELMEKSKVDPAGMLSLMQVLQRETKGEEPSHFLSTHPLFSERIKNIESRAARLGKPEHPNAEIESIFKELHSRY